MHSTETNAREALTAALRETTRYIAAGEGLRAAMILASLAELGYVVQPGPELQAAIDNVTECCPNDCLTMCQTELTAPVRPDAAADGSGWPDLPALGDQSTVATEAHAAVYGQRQGDYGHPREDFTRTAILWTGLLQHKLADGEYIEAEDVPRLQIAVKLSRDVNAPKRDNRVDMAGYAITLDRLETGR